MKEIRTGTRRDLLPLLVLLPIAAVLLLADLGGPPLWEDEGDTAVFARSILAHGMPVAWDGRAFLDSDDGLRVAPRLFGVSLVMIGTPWLPYYATAASFGFLGESEWAARLPFAIAAIGCIALLYAWMLRTTGDARAAFGAALLLLASTQFLLYGRESRSYALNMLLTLLLFIGYGRLGRRRRDPWLVIAAVALFHVQPVPAAIALLACGGLALLHRAERPRLWPLLLRAPLVAACTLPWLAISWAAAGTNAHPLSSLGDLPSRLGQLVAESAIAIPLLAWIGLGWLARGRLREGDRAVLRLAFAWMFVATLVAPLFLSTALLEVVGLRYLCALLPIGCAVTGLLIARASAGRPLRYASLLAVLAGTHLLGPALPWLAIGDTRRIGDVLVHVPREAFDKVVNTTWWYFVRGLGQRDPATLSALVELLRREAGPDDVVLTNFGWDNLYFYTRLPQSMRISPAAVEVRREAQRLRLPSFLTGVRGSDWLIWRGGDEDALGYTFTIFGQVDWPMLETRLATLGATIEPMATLPETLWENRPELYWHRFPRVGQPFAPHALGAAGSNHGEAHVYRVRWPGGSPVSPE